MALSILSYDGEYLDRVWLRDETQSFNERLQLYRTIDASELFRKRFFEERSEFEDRINLLLSLLSLSPLKCGGISTLTDAPDILACSVQRHVYVIECTTGDINNKGKLQKLHSRTKRIGQALTTFRHPVTAIQAVMFTSLPREETRAYWEMAKNFRIALVCREEIEGLLQQIDVPPLPEQMYQAALAAIPK